MPYDRTIQNLAPLILSSCRWIIVRLTSGIWTDYLEEWPTCWNLAKLSVNKYTCFIVLLSGPKD